MNRKLFSRTGCPISLGPLSFCHFLGFWSTYRGTFHSHWIDHEILIPKLTLLSILREPEKITKTKWAQWYGTPCRRYILQESRHCLWKCFNRIFSSWKCYLLRHLLQILCSEKFCWHLHKWCSQTTSWPLPSTMGEGWRTASWSIQPAARYLTMQMYLVFKF